MKKKVVIIAATAAVVVIGAGIFGAFKLGFIGGSGSDSEYDIYVDKLSTYVGASTGYTTNVFMGIVEGQEATGVTKSSEREVKELFVAVGDTVEEGDKLFSYTTDALEEEIVQYGFDIEGYNLQVADYNRQLTNLTNTLNKTSDALDREDLQNQIDAINSSVAITQNSIEQTNSKIAEAKKKIDNSTVFAPSKGIITKIQNSDSDSFSSDGYYITMLASNELRVKGTINEQNVWSINLDTPVTVRSRVDSNQTWSGVITKIETETKNEDSNNGDYYYGGGSSENSSTSYPFYVTLDSSAGLMMGQHLYIELGEQEEAFDITSGTYIYDYLVSYDMDGSPYVWSMGRGSKLVKKYITLGEYNADQMMFEILDGLTYDDMIAYPMDDYEEGMHCISMSEGE